MLDLTGKRFERLKVLGVYKKDKHHVYWRCKCDCGKEKIVRNQHLVGGKIRSCGCLAREVSRKIMKNNRIGSKHGLSKTRIYRIWMAMKSRCKYRRYTNYEGRGIKVCEEWKRDFMEFCSWALKNGYQDNLTIDRIDVDGNYCPENCRWITNDEQQNNRRNNHKVLYLGKEYTLAQLSRKIGIPESTIWNRVKKGMF